MHNQAYACIFNIDMMARLLAAGVALVLLCSALWLVFAWPRSPALAIGGLVAATLVYPTLIALQFALMRRINRNDAVPVPGKAQTLRAWWAVMCTAVRVFCWDQPFRSRAEPDWLPTQPTGQRGVVLVHGFVCNRAFWRPWFAPLKHAGHAFEAVNLEPVFGAIDAYSPIIDAAVLRVQAATGMAPVLVCHSMGGLAVRAWLNTQSAQHRVHHVITLGTPHRGTWLARFSRAASGRQMALGGNWTQALAQAEPPGRAALFTCWYSNCDNVVFPASSATLPGADNRLIAGVAHVQMARHAEVMDACLRTIRASEAAQKL